MATPAPLVAVLMGSASDWETMQQGWATEGLDALLSIAQMPGGVPVGTLAIGKAGAKNAAILAAQILGLSDPAIARAAVAMREAQSQGATDLPPPAGA